jgi:hypothetical protein
VVGALLAVLNCSVDIAYVARSIFFSQLVFILCTLFVVLRGASALLIGQIYFTKYVVTYKPKMSEGVDNEHEEEVDEQGRSDSKKHKEIR